jgi:hypothetical protein
MSLKTKLSDPRLYSLALVILLFVSVQLPLTIPLDFDPYTKDFFDVMESLEEDDIVLICFGMSNKGDTWYPLLTVFEQIKRLPPLRIVWYVTDKFALTLDEEFKNAVYGDPWVENVDYGTRFAYFGYQGNAIKVDVLLKPEAVIPRDYFGTPITDIPLMQEIQDPSYYTVVLTMVTPETDWALGPRMITLSKQWGFELLTAGASDVTSGGSLTSWAAGNIAGLFGGDRSAIQYATALGIYTPSSKYYNPGLFVGLFTAIMIVVVNVNRRWGRK